MCGRVERSGNRNDRTGRSHRHRSGRIPGPRGMDLWRLLSSLSDRPQERFLELALRYGRCIGFRFAQLEGQVILATLAQSFSVRLKPGQEVVPEARLNLPPRMVSTCTWNRAGRQRRPPRPSHTDATARTWSSRRSVSPDPVTRVPDNRRHPWAARAGARHRAPRAVARGSRVPPRSRAALRPGGVHAVPGRDGRPGE